MAFGVGTALFLATGNRRFLRFALQLPKWMPILVLPLFRLIAFERLMAPAWLALADLVSGHN